MSDENTILAESQSAEAVNAAAVHAEAVEKSRKAQLDSAIVSHREETLSLFKGALRDILSEGNEGTKMLLIQKIPLLCADIITIRGDITWIKWINGIGVSLLAAIGLPVSGWMILQIIKNSTNIAALSALIHK